MVAVLGVIKHIIQIPSRPFMLPLAKSTVGDYRLSVAYTSKYRVFALLGQTLYQRKS